MRRRTRLVFGGALLLAAVLALTIGCAGGTPPAAPTAAVTSPSTSAPAASPTLPAVPPTTTVPTPTQAAPGARSTVSPALPSPTAAVQPSSPAASAPVGDAAAGKQIYDANCAVCHQANGSGGVKLGTATSADLRAPDLEKTYYNNDSLIARAILTGVDQDGKPLNPVMPKWQGTLSQKQVYDVIAYLKTLKE